MKIVDNEEGGVVVEFSMILVHFFFFLIVFFQVAGIIVAHERLSMVASSVSRIYETDGMGEAYKKLTEVGNGIKMQLHRFSKDKCALKFEKDIDLLIDFTNITSKRRASYRLEKTVFVATGGY